MKIKFWGVRGSIATPGGGTRRYGGNTPCISVRLDDGNLIILDAGTGIRLLGNQLWSRYKPISCSIFFSHFHLDHIAGFPFFRPVFGPDNVLNIYGCPGNGMSVSECFDDLMKNPFSPVAMSTFRAKFNLINMCEGDIKIGGATIEMLPINHPGGGRSYKISEAGKCCIYMTDNELVFDRDYPTDYKSLLNFIKGADILIHDATYTNEEWSLRRGWGHSSLDKAIELAADAGVKTLVPFHYDPSHDDATMDKIIENCRKLVKRKDLSLALFPAQEGEEMGL